MNNKAASKGPVPLLRNVVNGFFRDHTSTQAAALAYYTVFSLAPLLIISISIAGFFFGEEAARGEIVQQLTGLVGEDSARTIEDLVINAARPGAGSVAALIGLATLLFGATTVFAELKGGLDRIWEVAPATPVAGLVYLLRSRLLSFGMILAIGFLLLVSLVFSAVMAAMQRYWFIDPAAGWLLEALNFLVAYLMVAVLFGAIYKMMPAVRIAWGDVVMGALVTSLLFVIGKELLGYYLGRSAVASAYGAAASVVLILVWVYFSALIFLLGAEFTKAWSQMYGSLSRVTGASEYPTRDAPRPRPRRPTSPAR